MFENLNPFTLYPDPEPVSRVVVNNARGHAYPEIGDPLLEVPDHVALVPLEQLSPEQRDTFEAANHRFGRRRQFSDRQEDRDLPLTRLL